MCSLVLLNSNNGTWLYLAIHSSVSRHLSVYQFTFSSVHRGTLCPYYSSFLGKRRRGITCTSNTVQYLGDYRLYVCANMWEAERRMNSKLNVQT